MTQTDKLELAANTRRVVLRATVGRVPGHCGGKGGWGARQASEEVGLERAGPEPQVGHWRKGVHKASRESQRKGESFEL